VKLQLECSHTNQVVYPAKFDNRELPYYPSSIVYFNMDDLYGEDDAILDSPINYNSDLGIRRRFYKLRKKQKELENRLRELELKEERGLSFSDGDWTEDSNIRQALLEMSIDKSSYRHISQLFHLEYEEPTVLSPSFRPMVGDRHFLPAATNNAIGVNNNAMFEIHKVCAKCAQLQTLISSILVDSISEDEKMTPDEFWKVPREMIRLPSHGTGVELYHSSKSCHSCTIIRDSWLDRRGDEAYFQDRFGYDFEAARQSRLKCLLNTTDILLEIPRVNNNDISVLMEVKLELPTHLIQSEAQLKSFVELRSRPMQYTTSVYITLWHTHAWQGPGEWHSMSTASGKSLRKLYNWFVECTEQHELCRRSVKTTLPKRLLLVEQFAQDLFVRLVLTSTLSPHYNKNYAALSYCWGGQQTFQLTAKTEQMLLLGVPIGRLPATIRDSAKVTKGLGLQFLWVDALCIFQDSPTDFEEQSAAMADIYLGCSICISAVGASKASDGLFSQRDTLKYSPCYMSPDLRSNKRDAYIWLQPSKRDPKAMSPWPLHLRAWAVQERLLPPRMVKFGPYLSWECRFAFCDEFGYERSQDVDRPTTLSNSFVTTFFDRLLSEDLLQSFRSLFVCFPERTDVEEMRYIWYKILQEYSECRLTYKCDRLRAISGIISAIEQRTGWKNSNGLWLPFIVEEMLWETCHHECFKPSRTGLHPSWSWVATDSYIQPRFVPDEYDQFELVSRFEKLVNTKDFGFPSSLKCISLHCLAVRVRREPGLGKTSGLTENLMVVDDSANEDMKIKFTKDCIESKVLPQLFLAIARHERPLTYYGFKRIEGIVVGLYPTRHKPYLYQRLGRGSCSQAGLLENHALRDESLQKSYFLI
jgi:Heterokaryon incompatibility protein (HET)